MNGIHDMGGLHGFGAVPIETDEPVFHSRWESRVYALTQVIDTAGIWNLDEHRHEIEKMDAAAYLTVRYYGRWLFAMERLLDRKNIVRTHEVERRIEGGAEGAQTQDPLSAIGRSWPLSDHQKIRWGAWRHEVAVQPKYSVGQSVCVRNMHPEGHTRVTAYTRGRVGTVAAVNAQAWVLPDTRADHRGENLQPVYNVRFSATELWGPQAEANPFMRIDLSEDHPETAEVTS